MKNIFKVKFKKQGVLDQSWRVCCCLQHAWVELHLAVAHSEKLSTEFPPRLSHAAEPQWATLKHTQTHEAQPFSLTEPLAHWAQLVSESTPELHIWCQCSVRGRPSGLVEEGGSWDKSKETGNTTHAGPSSRLHSSMYVYKSGLVRRVH